MVRDPKTVAQDRHRLTGETLKFLLRGGHDRANSLIPDDEQAVLEAALIGLDPTQSEFEASLLGATYITACSNQARGRAAVVTALPNAFRRVARLQEVPASGVHVIRTPLGPIHAQFHSDGRSLGNSYVAMRGGDSLVVIIGRPSVPAPARIGAARSAPVALAGSLLRRLRASAQQSERAVSTLEHHRMCLVVATAVRHLGIKEPLLTGATFRLHSEDYVELEWVTSRPRRSRAFQELCEDGELALTVLNDSVGSSDRLRLTIGDQTVELLDTESDTTLSFVFPWFERACAGRQP